MAGRAYLIPKLDRGALCMGALAEQYIETGTWCTIDDVWARVGGHMVCTRDYVQKYLRNAGTVMHGGVHGRPVYKPTPEYLRAMVISARTSLALTLKGLALTLKGEVAS